MFHNVLKSGKIRPVIKGEDPKENALALTRPIYLVARTLGVAPYAFQGSVITKGRLPGVYILYSWLILSGCLLNFLLSPVPRKPLRLLHDISNVSTCAACIITILAIRTDMIKMVAKLQEIHWDLGHFRYERRKYCLLAAFWILTVTGMCVYNIHYGLTGDKYIGAYFAGVYYLPNYLSSMICFHFGAYVFVIYSYLTRLKSNFENMGGREGLIAARRMYGRLCTAARSLNTNYNVPLTLIFTTTFLNVTETVYLWLSTDFAGTADLVDSAIWVLSNSIRIVFVTFGSEKITHKVKELAEVIHLKLMDITDPEEYNLMLQFSLQLIHEDISFWASGLFQINNNLLYGMLGAITTYSVLIFQLKTH